VIDFPSRINFITPRKIASVARVVIREFTCSFVIANALMPATSITAAKAAAIAPNTPPDVVTTTAKQAAPKPSAEPTDKSICRTTSRRVMGRAMIPMTDMFSITLKTFVAVKKTGL